MTVLSTLDESGQTFFQFGWETQEFVKVTDSMSYLALSSEQIKGLLLPHACSSRDTRVDMALFLLRTHDSYFPEKRRGLGLQDRLEKVA